VSHTISERVLDEHGSRGLPRTLIAVGFVLVGMNEEARGVSHSGSLACLALSIPVADYTPFLPECDDHSYGISSKIHVHEHSMPLCQYPSPEAGGKQP
jgi:hypothetical protein